MDFTKQSSNTNFYNSYYAHSYDFKGTLEYSKYLISKLGGNYFKNGYKILDAGCGVGILGSEIINQFGTEVYGFDISKIAVKKAKEYGIKSKVASINKPWPYKISSFDVVISQQVIEHLINPDYFLQQAKKILKKNGYLIITTPNLANWFNRIIFLFGFQPFFSEVSTLDKTLGLKFTRKLTSNRHPLGHLHVFTTRALIDLLELHNFEVVKVMGGKISYLPKIMRPLDALFSNFSSLGSDIIIVAKNR